uniref:lysozyme n=1 Tax=Stomoxys calcitrans TaxID=35570 RepID=A0A1I8PGV2_STOCA
MLSSRPRDIATWVCIAEHQSSFDSSAVGRQNGDGSANYGLFQISDRYWCYSGPTPEEGKACNVACHKLADEDLQDDVRCIRIIYDEHTRISGNGFNAWTVYSRSCQNQNIEQIRQCFDAKVLDNINTLPSTNSSSNEVVSSVVSVSKPGKVYDKCELAQELYHKHQMPMDQIATWVCIAQHESNFRTSAVGRLNADGSADHGLFQISDLYWCSHDRYGGKACNIPCDRLLDSDITDDVRCIKIIHEEHTRISGDGFNAWAVYKPHCLNQGLERVKQCFSEKDLKDSQTKTVSAGNKNSFTSSSSSTAVSKKGKIYNKCELAKELYHKHHMPMEQIPTWVCIAQHESSYNTAAVGRLNTDGSADHGLFQISDLYWCTHDQYGGKTCNIPCDRLLDSDISDDISCIKIIHDEHTRISGDGFNAWAVYKPHCRNQGLDRVKECFTEKELKDIPIKSTYSPSSNALVPQQSSAATKKGKIYKKCELAQELYQKHRMPMDQIPTWVCIAQHESSYNTAAVGRLNTDGSADHGLFQISDLYWCTHDQYGGKACNIPCDRLLDSDISDDIRCIKIIYDEHTRISGDGFNAWAVYKPHCRNQGLDRVKECFTDEELKDSATKSITGPYDNSLIPQSSPATTKKGKVYNKCELAQELYHKHRLPMDQIPTWVCIAQHESSYNTAAVGRLNTDGSADHGLFQISDLYWCTHDQYGGKACNIPCDKLLDSDISDDIRCIKIIHEEHTRISGDGFNAWAVYKPHCRNQRMESVKQCFTEQELTYSSSNAVAVISTNSIDFQVSTAGKKGKIYKKCELAQELYHKHHLPIEQIPTWVCIAQHESSYNTAAVGRLNTDGSADHGLFQISDLYWCSHDPYGGKACNIPCDRLLDSDISDDVRCIKIIHDEHTHISGDGFNAWAVYKPHCRNQGLERVKECFSENELRDSKPKGSPSLNSNTITHQSPKPSTKKGKIYKKCELAQELLHKHRLPLNQIPTWVCIAQHESSYNTAAVGRLNTDGSADHGLFQISDLYWCTHDQYGGKACNIACDRLLDSDISDDVQCIKMIHEEHTGISGDGFNAWAVYKPHCRNQGLERIKECFKENELADLDSIKPITPISSNALKPAVSNKQAPAKGKIYKKCELAQELYAKHKMPMEQIPTWVCIAQHESSFNTAAVGRLNADGSADHGLFQISDLYWCSHDPYGGKACNIPCDKLLDSDITDDVRCIKIIHEEHTQISGDGFNAWAVYKPHCRNRQFSDVQSCFSSNEIQLFEKNKADKYQPSNYNAPTKKPGDYSHNPFLQNIKVSASSAQAPAKVATAVQVNVIPNTNNYKNNPFLSGAIKTSSISSPLGSSSTQKEVVQNYQNNPFLNGLPKTTPTTVKTSTTSKSTTSSSLQSASYQQQYATTSISQPSKYVNSNDFRTKPSDKPQSYGSTSQPSKYSDSNSFRITTKMPTTYKPTTLRPTTTTSKPRTTATAKTTTTRKSTINTTKGASNWNDGKYRPLSVTGTTTTKKPTTTTKRTTTTTTKRSTTSWTSTKSSSATTSKPTTWWTSTTKSSKGISSAQLKESTTTRKPTTTPTTRKPTSTTRSWNNGPTTRKTPTTSWTTTTRKPTSTTRNWNNAQTAKLKQTTAIQKPTTTTKKPTSTTWSWNHGQTPTTRKTPTTSWTTTRKPTTTLRTTNTPKATTATWNWNNGQYKGGNPTTTRKPSTIAGNWNSSGQYKATSPTTTKRPTQTTTTRKTSTTKNYSNTTTWNWNNRQTTNTPKTITTTRTTTTTRRPSLSPTKSSNNWNWSTTTTKHLASKATARTTTTTTTTTRKPLNVTPSPRSQTTTKSPSANTNWNWQQPKYSNTSATTSWNSKTTNKPSQLTTNTTWQHWQNGQPATTSQSYKTTTTSKPQTQSGNWQNNKTTNSKFSTKAPQNTQTTRKSDDLFKHPFFERVKQEREIFESNLSNYQKRKN